MTRRQYWTIMLALATLLVVWVGTLALSQRATCERGNVTRAHLANRVAPADCGLLDVVGGP